MIKIVFLFQASFEPAFLPIGTDVSAKYRGAFCEAKVKKLVKSVKCKVSCMNKEKSTTMNILYVIIWLWM